MWWSRPTRRGLLGAGLALAGCGFVPAMGEGGAGRFRGATAITAPATVDGYRLLARIEDRLGRADAARWHLTVTLDTDESSAAYGADGSIGRATVTGQAGWRLTEGADGPLVGEGRARAFAGYDSGLSNTVALRAAAIDAHERLMVQLADQIVTQMLALGAG
ncbi:MAG: hypothetical protein H3C51_00135 [Rubellimicrobium sp.]|nr:hypothetical protein [Rubellimicrobium sp.]